MNDARTYRFRFPGKGIQIILIAFLALQVQGQVVINEFGASNTFTIEDPDYEESADWVEIYNEGTQPVNLKDYYLTDDFNSPAKWQIQGDAVIGPGGFLLIWSDGRNSVLHTGFKLSAEGEELVLSAPDLTLVDSVSFSNQVSDVSYGRKTDGSPEWGYFREPTPGSTNNTQSFQGIVFNIPTFSLRGGFYSTSQTLELSSEFGGSIHFTTDGSEPTENSSLYTGPLELAVTTIVRARIIKTEMIGGPVLTNSYFINENSAGGKLPVVSISTDPENFWDPATGIYVQDFKPDWEVPVNIELFENNGTDRAAFNRRAGVKINGLNSWRLPQKMLGMYFRKSYGSGSLDYRVTPQRKRNSYKNFALRASGSDWSYTLLRDVVSHHATLNNTNIDIMGFKPSVVFVNGDYLGIHNIREKVDANYIEESYGLGPGTFDMVENTINPEAGDLLAYQDFQELLSTDLSVGANYDALAAQADIEEVTDYMIAEMAVRNTSIDHNVMAWKPKEGGKWRWILMDLDRGYFDAASYQLDFYLAQRHLILGDLFENQGYRAYFARRLASLLFTTFNPELMVDLIDRHEALIGDEIPRHIQRWQGTVSSYGNAMPSETYWREQVCNLRSFVEERPATLLADLQNYGFSGPANLVVDCSPPEAGPVQLNGLKIMSPLSYGPYPKDIPARIEAPDKPGYDFAGFYESPEVLIVPKGSTWKYRDNGIDPGSTWKETFYDDASWSEGPAELGYGDNDENTVISYGGNGSDKYITSWFRKSFEVSQTRVRDGVFFLHLLKDDGAIVYLNGEEVLRLNLPCGNTDPGTLASTAIGGETEQIFITKRIDNALLQSGSNLLAVEIHQASVNSSDLSFDLALSCYLPDSSVLYDAGRELDLILEGDLFLTARYGSNTSCRVPEIVDSDMTLSVDCSPYLVNGDVTINENATLTIDPGVEILMPEGGNILVGGRLIANGTSSEPVAFRLNPEYQDGAWGGIVFRNTPETSTLNFVTLEDASEGPDPVLENAAISSFDAGLVIDHLVIENVMSNPVVSRYSDITLTNSRLHSEVTGDLINVKYGHAMIGNCRFTGNNRTDADAIDFDGVEDGVIRNSVVSGLTGFNSDAVDIGEESRNVLVDSLVVFDVFDKGVSVGQHASVVVRNSLFINCNMGVAVKDSGSARIVNCTFYGTGFPVACYEKNIGLAGGNARVMNSILSNSYEASYRADAKSNIRLEYSLSDNTSLPGGVSNLQGNPQFAQPSYFDFSLAQASPAAGTGYSSTGPVDMGASSVAVSFEPPIMISRFFINGSGLDLPEFICLYNPSDKEVNLSGYGIDKGVTALIPAGTSIAPEGRVYLTDNTGYPYWDNFPLPLFQWSDGKLSNNGESLRLVDNHGIVQDYFVYSDQTWPAGGFKGNHAFRLIDPALDNHFSGNWTTASIADAVEIFSTRLDGSFSVYPNPTSGILHIDLPPAGLSGKRITGGTASGDSFGALYDLRGRLLCRFRLDTAGTTSVDLSRFGEGLYLIRIGIRTKKVMVVE